jgi:hypothetical protein
MSVAGFIELSHLLPPYWRAARTTALVGKRLAPVGILKDQFSRHHECAWGQPCRRGRGFCWTDALFKMSVVGSLSVSPLGRTDNAFFERAGHVSISALDVRTGRLQWETAVHWREHHKIEYKLEASLRQLRPRRLGKCRRTAAGGTRAGQLTRRAMSVAHARKQDSWM